MLTFNKGSATMNTSVKCGLIVAGITAAVAAIPAAWAQTGSGTCAPVAIPHHYGPVDYVSAAGTEALDIVNRAHFTARVESLAGGSTGYMGQDLGYTLNAVPNHHRALLAASRLAAREKTDQPAYLTFSVSCYFDRATRFRPADTVVRGLYAKYLHDFLNRKDEALRQVDFAAQHAGDNAFTHFNAGLLYLEMGEYNKAAEQAAKARDMGFPREDLIDRLKTSGHWPPKNESAKGMKTEPSAEDVKPEASVRP